MSSRRKAAKNPIRSAIAGGFRSRWEGSGPVVWMAREDEVVEAVLQRDRAR